MYMQWEKDFLTVTHEILWGWRSYKVPESLEKEIEKRGYEVFEWFAEASDLALEVSRGNVSLKQGKKFIPLRIEDFHQYPGSTKSPGACEFYLRFGISDELELNTKEKIQDWIRRMISLGLQAPYLAIYISEEGVLTKYTGLMKNNLDN